MILRELQRIITEQLYKGKVILVYGARRVGKTSLVKNIMADLPNEGVYLNCEFNETKDLLQATSRAVIERIAKTSNLIVLDEAQDIKDIGKKIKLLHDEFPNVQIIATGSSALDLAQSTNEPLTGRSRIYQMHALSFYEILNASDPLSAHNNLETQLLFGSYPEVYIQETSNHKIEELENIASNYLYKDVLKYGNLRKPQLLYDLLKILSLQIGREISLNKLSNQLNTSIQTIAHYLDLLEKSFVIFQLSSFSRNLTKEIGKKILFLRGIRNAIIRNFSHFNVWCSDKLYCIIVKTERI